MRARTDSGNWDTRIYRGNGKYNRNYYSIRGSIGIMENKMETTMGNYGIIIKIHVLGVFT